MDPLGMAAHYPKQSCDRVFGDVDQAGGGPHSTPFTQMIDDGRCSFLCDLGIEQRGATSLGELLATRPAAQEPDVVLTVDFAHREIILARETKALAFRIDTRESIEVGSLHEILLENSWLLSQGLHTTRHLLSTSVMITGHYRTPTQHRCT
jgi:hypothetical protein